ncbi:MAG: bifunctional diaminohydroxyphosphoribosylaminopyrimidine deaminase/5-amino-6-(5-phosphoribosylamino)uracil reductase RibD [Gammaproteobacteria bacterium]|nr:bifunctional diaminohydroxyphosphoribosylaminopyrimidine deaminase/5-amino-6-(5-phosphoribosylamino)uracil reductase RibD [Gammaproteobacteria bacterium]
MARALRLAQRGLYSTDPNPRVGCVIARDGEILGEGWHQRAGEAHAEVLAIKAAGDQTRGATAYVTLEPCNHQGRTPPCTEALIKAGVARVVMASNDPNPQANCGALQRLREAGIEVERGVMEAEALALNPGYVSRMTRSRPWVRIKMAASLDGRTAMASGQSKWISSAAAREDVQYWRARSSAILTGVGTVLADDPSLNVRLDGVERQPLRVVVDSHLSTPDSAKLFASTGGVLIVTTSDDKNYSERLRSAGAEVMLLPASTGGVDLAEMMAQLGQQQINEVMVEAGATLAGALLTANLVDELIVYLAPHLMGNQARGMFNLAALEQLGDRIALDIVDVRPVGRDWRIQAKVTRSVAKGG